MRLFETIGLDGKKCGECLGEAKTPSELWKLINAFKDSHHDILKVEPYDRLLQLESGNLVIDFGDYSRFLLVESDGSKSDLKTLEDFWDPSGK